MAGRHAYLILSHTNPGQLKKLLYTLDDPRNDIFVHIDRNASFSPKDMEGACSRAALEFISPRIRVSWGGVSIVRAEMALLEAAVKTEHSYYHLLSGMDLPIKNQDIIHRFFEENDGYEFISLWDNAHAVNRVHHRYPFPEGSGFFLTNALNNLAYAIQKSLGIRRNMDIDFKQGSQWFSITHAFAWYITERKEWVKKVFEGTRICDEFLISTLLWNSPFRDRLYFKECQNGQIINTSTMRYIDWTRGKSVRHPGVFTIDDLDLLKGVPHLWARKFDEKVDSSIIDAIVSLTTAGV